MKCSLKKAAVFFFWGGGEGCRRTSRIYRFLGVSWALYSYLVWSSVNDSFVSLYCLCLWSPTTAPIRFSRRCRMRFLVRASYLQIYNEQISDLLKPERTNLTIREDKKRGVFVEGLSEWVVRDVVSKKKDGMCYGSGVRAVFIFFLWAASFST